MSRFSQQLPFPLHGPPEYSRDAYVVSASNREAARLVEAWPDWPSSTALLTGPTGCGKSHLAHIWAERSSAVVVAAEALSGRSAEHLGARGTIVVEDVAAELVPQRELFHLLNAAREAGGSVLLTARAPVRDWRISLPDLASRLRLAMPIRLSEPDDDLLRQVLFKLFADRQLIVERPVVDYLVVRIERSLAAANRIVDLIDREALSAHRAVSRAFAADVLTQLEEQEGERTLDS
jgi:chromosomal replication initiation ATPase DnaA